MLALLNGFSRRFALVDLEAMASSPRGRLVPISGTDQRRGKFSYFAFFPDPLPPSIPIQEPTVSVVADAAMALGRLDVAANSLPNPALLARPVLTKEALSTSALEGTYAPLTEVLEGEAVGRRDLSPEANEVLNYVEAAFRGIEMLQSRPISFNLLAELQGILVKGTRGDSFDAGQLRKRQVLIGSPNAPMEQARFVPPPPGVDLREAVSDWEKWLHADTDIHLLVRIAVGHYQFEALHPFSDGNGRLGRLVVTLQLIESGTLLHPLLNMSEWLEPRKDEYLRRLLATSVDGDFDSWINFFCSGIKAQAETSTNRIERLVGLGQRLAARVRAGGSRAGTAQQLAEQLIGYPIFDISLVARVGEIGYQSAREAVLRLLDLGIVTEVRRGRRRLFVADEVIKELER